MDTASGTGLHEAPILHPGNAVPLEPGMVLAIEPMLKATEQGECYHSEDLVVVTDGGPSSSPSHSVNCSDKGVMRPPVDDDLDTHARCVRGSGDSRERPSELVRAYLTNVLNGGDQFGGGI